MKMGMSMNMEPFDEMKLKRESPEYDEGKLKKLVDLAARASLQSPYELSEELIMELYEHGIEFLPKRNCYFVRDEVLTKGYFANLGYIAAETGSKKVDIRFTNQIDLKCIDEIVDEFCDERDIDLDITNKRIEGKKRRKYWKSITTSFDDEIARVHMNKISFVHDKIGYDPDTHELGLDLVSRISAELHRKELFKKSEIIKFSDYSPILHLTTDMGASRTNYLEVVLQGLDNFMQDKNLEREIPNPMKYGENIKAEDIFQKAKKGGYFVKDEYKKRHIDYIYASEDGRLVIKLDSELDSNAIRREMLPLTEIRDRVDEDGNEIWIAEEHMTDGRKRELSAVNNYVPRQSEGSRILRHTEYKHIHIENEKNRLYIKEGKPLITFGERTIKLEPEDYDSAVEKELAFKVADRIYDKMLFYTHSTITHKGSTASVMSDEQDIIRTINRTTDYIMKHDYNKEMNRDFAKLYALNYWLGKLRENYAEFLVEVHGEEKGKKMLELYGLSKDYEKKNGGEK